MTEDGVYDWPTERDRATRLFGGDTPGPALEAGIIEVFTTNPLAVTQAIDRVAERWANGNIRSPWAVLRIEAVKAITPQQYVQATDNTTRALAEARVEQWVRAAGLHFDVWPEVHDEVFGHLGKLHTWADDQALVARVRAAWDTHRPAGEQVEADELDRAEKWKATNPLSRDYKSPPKESPSETAEAA